MTVLCIELFLEHPRWYVILKPPCFDVLSIPEIYIEVPTTSIQRFSCYYYLFFANIASGWYLRVYRGVFSRGKWKTITSICCSETDSVFCHHVEGSVWTSLSWGSRKSNVASSSTVTVVGARHQHWRCSSQKASVQLWVHTLRHEVFLKHLFHDFNKNDRWLETLLLRKEKKKSYHL